MHPSTWTKPQVLLRCITIAVIGFGCASSHLREPVVVMSPQDTEDLVSIHLAACRWQTLFTISRCNEIQVSRYKVFMHCLTITQCCSWNWSILKLWSTHHGMSTFPNCKAWHIRLQLGWLLAINGFFAHSAACNKQKRSFLFFSAFCMFWPVCFIYRWQRETTHMFQLCIPSEFRPKVGPNPSFLSGSSNNITI